MNALLKLPLILFATIPAAPYWMFLRTWFGVSFLLLMSWAFMMLVLSHQFFASNGVPDYSTEPFMYIGYQYTSFAQVIWPVFLVYQGAVFILQQIGITVFKWQRPNPWSMGDQLFGDRTPPAFILIFFFLSLAFVSLQFYPE